MAGLIDDTGLIVLCGGRSRRFGADKAACVVGGATLMERVVSVLSVFDREIIFVGASPLPAPQPGKIMSRWASDVYPGAGPLGAVYSGLSVSSRPYNLVVACDMPFLNRELLSHMMAAASGYDLVIPRSGDYVEPLHAVYARGCREVLGQLIVQGQLQLQALLSRVRVRYIDEAEWLRFDPDRRSFFNINTREDLVRAQRIAAGGV
jgi:molybdenum cofactor guanylyltransferase